MIIPKNWNEIEAKEVGDFTTLSLGGHICKILDVREYTSELSENTSLKVSIDIAEGDEYDGYFQKQFDANKSDKKKWPSGAVKYLSLKEEQTAYLKGFIQAVKNSNPTSKIVVEPGKELDCEQFKNKVIVGVFGWEEYENDKKEIKTTTKLTNFRSLDKLSEVKIPRVKLISGEMVEYEEYQKSKNTSNSRQLTDKEIDDFLDKSGIEL